MRPTGSGGGLSPRTFAARPGAIFARFAGSGFAAVRVRLARAAESGVGARREFPECPGKGRGKTIAPSATGKAFFRPPVRIRRVRGNAARNGAGARRRRRRVRRRGMTFAAVRRRRRPRRISRRAGAASAGSGRRLSPPNIRGAFSRAISRRCQSAVSPPCASALPRRGSGVQRAFPFALVFGIGKQSRPVATGKAFFRRIVRRRFRMRRIMQRRVPRHSGSIRPIRVVVNQQFRQPPPRYPPRIMQRGVRSPPLTKRIAPES